MFKKITKGWLIGLIVLMLGLLTTRVIYSDSRTSLEKAFKIDERVVNKADTSLDINNELNSLAAEIREVCQDEIDPATGELISEGYFKYSVDTNNLRVEVDKTSGYTIGDGNFSISFSRKCPGLIGDKLLPNSGTVVGTIKFSGHKQKDSNKLSGSYRLSAKLPPTIKTSGSWTGEVSDSKVSGVLKMEVGISKYTVDLVVPFSANLTDVKKEFRLIDFGVEAGETKVDILEPYKVELLADGEQSHEFSVRVFNQAKLVNKKNNNQIIELAEIGLEGENLKVKNPSFLVCCDGLSHRDVEWGTINGETKQVEIKTDKDGLAKFNYLSPHIEHEKFSSGRVTLQVLHKIYNPKAYITLKPAAGKIRGELITFEGKKFPHDVKIEVVDPNGKKEEKTLKGGTGKFVMITKTPKFGYQIRFKPTELAGRMINNLNYDVDLGQIVIGTVEEYEKATIKNVREFLKAAGIDRFVGSDQLEAMEFVYDKVDEECGEAKACYKDGKLYLESTNYWRELSQDHLETIYHEIFHGIHSFIAYDEVNWAQGLIDAKNNYFFGLGKGKPHNEWEECKTPLWKLNNSELAFDEAISHFMAHLALHYQGKDYLRRTLLQGNPLFNMTEDPRHTAPRDDYWQLNSVAPQNANKNGSTTEGKIVGFLLDYYQFKGMKTEEVMQDFFITLRDYQGMNDIHSARDINDWIVAKIYEAKKNNKREEILHLYEMASIHNIIVPDTGNITDMEMILNEGGKRSEWFSGLHAEIDGLSKQLDDMEKGREAAEKEYQRQRETAEHSADIKIDTDSFDPSNLEVNTEPDQVEKLSVGGADYQIQGNTSVNFNQAGGLNVNSGTVVVDGGSISDDRASYSDVGTRYKVEVLGDKTVLRVGKGMVRIYNKKTGERYLAEAGEEIEVREDKIKPVLSFDPKSDPDLQKGIMDYLNLTTILIGLGGLAVLGLVLKIVRRKK